MQLEINKEAKITHYHFGKEIFLRQRNIFVSYCKIINSIASCTLEFSIRGLRIELATRN